MKRYLITGGAGFIGSHLAEQLWHAGHHVTVLDDMSSGSLNNLRQLHGRKRFRLIEGSVLDQACVARAVAGTEVVFHLAARLGVERVVREVLSTLHTNVTGTSVVLEAARRCGAAVLVASSSEVYGQGYRLPMREDDPLLFGPTGTARWGYAYGKALDEVMTIRHHVEHGMHAVAVRFFNVAGPRQDPRQRMVVPSFVDAALAERPLELHGGGQAQRCFVHVADVVPALVVLSAQPAAAGQVVNVGSDEEITMRALAQRIKLMSGSRSSLFSIPTPQARGAEGAAIARRLPCLSKLRRLLGSWQPLDIDTIITDVVSDRRARHVGDSALDTAS